MKQHYILLLLISAFAHSQTTVTETEQFRTLGLVWGLMKYKHPDVSAGKQDWDRVFLEMASDVAGTVSQKNFDDRLLNFLRNYTLKASKIVSAGVPLQSTLNEYNNAFDWTLNIENETLRAELLKLELNTNIGDHYVSVNWLTRNLSFPKEKALPLFDFTNRSHRLLYFFRFWNVMQYCNVNTNLNDQKWIDVLDEMLPRFISAEEPADWNRAVLNLYSKVDDSHTNGYKNEEITKYYKGRWAVFGGTIINDSVVVTNIRNKALADKAGIAIGDVITHIDGVPYADFFNRELKPVLSLSNKNYGYWYTSRLGLMFSGKDSMAVSKVSKSGIRSETVIHQYSTFEVEPNAGINESIYTHGVMNLDDSITYVNLRNINMKTLQGVFKKNPKAVILDLRNYPKNIQIGALARILYPEQRSYMKLLLLHSPGHNIYDSDMPIQKIKDPLRMGRANKDYYKGRIILLVNRATVSMAEYFSMIIQQAPNVTTVGEQTAGAVMNVVSCPLPDGSSVSFTSAGAFYPDGTGVQRNGVKIDHYVQESALHYDRDLYIKEAVKILKGEVTSLNKKP